MKADASNTVKDANPGSEKAKIAEAGKVKEVKKNGICVRIRPTIKNGVIRFVLDYRANGQRKLVWRSTMAKARIAADEAIDKITEGQAEVLNLKSADAHAYTRSRAILDGGEGETKIDLQIDEAVRIAADCVRLLGGRVTPQEVCRDWLKRHAVELPKISVEDAVKELKKRDEANVDESRKHQLKVLLGRFTSDFHENVDDVQPIAVDEWLSKLTKIKGGAMSEKSKRNYRDTIGYFNRFCIARGYLAKGTDWLENARKYSAAKRGTIEIYTPEEFNKILTAADDRLVPFLAINGFAGIRHEEIARLDWKDVALEDGESFISIYADTAKTKVGRMVPVKKNLKNWLLNYRKDSGAVCEFANIWMQLPKVAEKAGLTWKKNALRHSYISYRKAECADIARVADEAGNSVEVIKGNYLKVIKPVVAAEWFSIQPPRPVS